MEAPPPPARIPQAVQDRRWAQSARAQTQAGSSSPDGAEQKEEEFVRRVFGSKTLLFCCFGESTNAPDKYLILCYNIIMNAHEDLPNFVDLSAAQTNPELRQEYLDSIDLGWAREYIVAVRYSPELQPPAFCQPDPRAQKGEKGHRSTILVGPRFFDPTWCHITNHAAVISVLRDHEGRHAQQFFNKPSVFLDIPKYPGAKTVGEWQAYREQTRGFIRDQLDVSEEFRDGVVNEAQDYKEFSRRNRKQLRAKKAEKTSQKLFQEQPPLANSTPEQKRAAQREFIQLQIAFAHHAARACGISFEKALLRNTRLYRQFGLPLDANRELDDQNVQWKEFLSHANTDEQLCTAALGMLPEHSREKTDNCFSYSYDDEDKAVNIHFENNDPDKKGPLSEERLDARKAEIRSLLLDIRKKFPQAKHVRGSSWLYNMPNYRKLFPPTYTDKMGTPRSLTTTMSLWGQFFSREGGLRRDRVQEFMTKLEKAKTEEELLDSFPLREWSAGCNIQDFYTYYDIT